VDINFYPFTLTTWFHLLSKHNPDKVTKAQTQVTHVYHSSLAFGKLAHAYFKGKNSTDKGIFSLRNRVNLQSNVCEVN
jgi:hypothetical protein